MELLDRLFCFNKKKINRIFYIRKSSLMQWIVVPKDKAVVWLAYIGFLFAFLGSLNPWFLWPIGTKFPIIVSVLLFSSFLIARTMRNDDMYTRNDLYMAFGVYVVLNLYLLMTNNRNINGYIVGLFNIFVFYILFRLNPTKFPGLMTFISKSFAVMMCVSIPFFILYLLGFSFPSGRAVFGENLYSFTNYYFFMIDDRSLWDIIPRFSSVFLEPGHLGTATIMLLLSQMGQWKRWYNIVLWITTLITFSLAAYVFALALLILNSWVQRRKIFAKILLAITVVVSIGAGSFIYNDGDNMVYNLIVMRLEIDEKSGEMVGNNRVTESFKREYESFLTSSDIWLGREMPKGDSGNSGYRVFIYENGLIALFLVTILYLLTYRFATDQRAILASFAIVILAFIVRGYPLWYSNFIPCMAAAYNKFKSINV